MTVHKSKLSFSLLIKLSIILAALVIYGGLKRKNQRKRTWKSYVEKFTLVDVKMIFHVVSFCSLLQIKGVYLNLI